MKIELEYTREELEEIVREENREKLQAPAKVRNARAFVAIGEHRALRWLGHYYNVPPVAFPPGAQLWVLRNLLTDVETPLEDLNAGVVQSRMVMHELVAPRRLAFGRNPFRAARLIEVLGLIEFFLYVPDETPVAISNAPRRTVDLIDGVMEYLAAGYPQRDGLPYSWAHYNYALRHIGRARAREDIRNANAVRMAKHPKYGDWYLEQSAAAGGVD